MSSQFPSIQSFYQREVRSSPTPNSSNPRSDGDGFTSSEVEAALNPLASWVPNRKYEKCPISHLEPGPHDYEITGRIVNYTTPAGMKKYPTQRNAEPGYFLLVSDGTGAIAVKVHYPKASDCSLLLGQRVTIWTSHISDPVNAEIGYIPLVTWATTLYPGRNGTTHIVFHEDVPSSEDDYSHRRPIELGAGRSDDLPGLMTLKSFLGGGHELPDCKLLVCVRSVGLRKTIRPRKREGIMDLIEVGVFDDTASCVLKLWEDKIPSAKSWTPISTILLLSRPTYNVWDRPGYRDGASGDIGLGYSTMVEVNPAFSEADWLRRRARDMTKKENALIPFPEGTWDIRLAMHGPMRELFRIAEVNELVRQDFHTEFTGKLNVVVMEMNLMENWRKGTTCCFDCCGIPLYANRATATCKNCQNVRELSLNPRVIGSVIDESGTIAGGKLVWSDNAWAQLFFGGSDDVQTPDIHESDWAGVEQSWEDLTALDTVSLRDVEDQILFSRLTLTFGWSPTLTRLCILGVEW